MCSIAGIIAARNSNVFNHAAAFSYMHHRGPDARGASLHEFAEYRIELLHTRLAIIDPRDIANQPFTLKHLTLTFNGEIFNYLELRSELQERGHNFKTRSDTEVLIRAYLEWGENFLDKIDGMWAFALFDASRGALLICRDRFGEKPLFLMHHRGNLFFASNIPTLNFLAGSAPTPNLEKIRRYLCGGFRLINKSNDTFFNGVLEFPAAHMSWINTTEVPVPQRYWALKYKPQKIARAELVGKVHDQILESVGKQVRADVPVAFCLSGGIDSSALAAIARATSRDQPNCFSVIDHDPRYDERDNIQATVQHLNCNHTQIFPDRRNFLDRMAAITPYHNGPVPTINYFLQASLLEEIAENGFKIAISGTGADEIFSGYYDHYAMWLALMEKRSANDPTIDFANLVAEWRAGYGLHVRNPALQTPDTFRNDINRRDYLMENAANFGKILVPPAHYSWTEEKYSEDALRNRMMNELLHEIVPVILAADDSNSMRVSIENRSPFLDRKLVELMYTVPSEELIVGGLAKSLLRDAINTLVPNSVRLDPRKRGFNASIDSLLDRSDPEVRERVLSDSPIFDIVDRRGVERLLNKNLQKNSYSKFMFAFISTKTFLESLKTNHFIPAKNG